jgi:hypothetical protein
LDLYTKEPTASPTISTDAQMLLLIVDAFEGRYVATAYVVGAYLLADMDVCKTRNREALHSATNVLSTASSWFARLYQTSQ